MKSIISQIKRKFASIAIQEIEKAFIISYGIQHNINYNNCYTIKKFIKSYNFTELSNFIQSKSCLNSLSDLVSAFEYLIDDTEKKNNGVVYTPELIRTYILHATLKSKHMPRIIDPACGCGAFLISAAQILHKEYNLSYRVIFSECIWGCDIDEHTIDKCKILLELLALQEEGIIYDSYYNLTVGNALEILSQDKYLGKFDIVIGNPPYVRSKNIDISIKASFSNWSVVTGNTDLYIPFYQLGYELLNDEGILGYISPNTFLQSVNGRGLRNYLRNTKRQITIINFKDVQKFIDVTHYTCITIIHKSICNATVMYSICEGDLANITLSAYNISDYRDDAEWRFGNNIIDKIVFNIEQQPTNLNTFNIRNGLATLSNDIYFFSTVDETDNFYIREYNGKKYHIEKNICINIAKPNIMRNENDLIYKSEKAIYPYKNGTIIHENEMKTIYPCTYTFLLEQKSKLLNRDKGKTGSYPEWYAYGRTQGMHNQGKKILIPYMADKGVAIISEDKDLLFYCGYAAFSDDIQILNILKSLIESNVFWFYIKMTSKPYSKGFMALAKNYIKNFGIPNMTNDEKSKLLTLKGEERERFIAKLYNVDYSTIKLYLKPAS